MGFLRPRQNNARTGRSGWALPPRRAGRLGGAGVSGPAIAVAVVDGAGAALATPSVSRPAFSTPLLLVAILRLRKNNERPLSMLPRSRVGQERYKNNNHKVPRQTTHKNAFYLINICNIERSNGVLGGHRLLTLIQ